MSSFRYALLCVHSTFAIILKRKRKLVALIIFSYRCIITLNVLFVCFAALRPKSAAMVMAGRSVHLTTLFFWASLNKQLTSTSFTHFRL